LERLANRKSRDGAVVSPELARYLTTISHEIQRQVGLLLDRRGRVRIAMVGDARGVFLPDLSAYRRGGNRLCGLRLVHTHLKPVGLDEDDFTDLALLRLDMVSAIEVESDGLPGKIHTAHLVAANVDERPWVVLPPGTVHEQPEDFPEVIAALEEEFARNRKSRKAGDGLERAILIHISDKPRTVAEASVAELRELCRSGGIVPAEEIIQRRRVDPKYVMGKGRLKTALIRSMQLGAEVLIFDSNLTPAQVKNLADYTDLKVLDRTQVILDIFAQRAQDREGRIQVELAQLRYLLPRLSGKHTAMSRLTGGIGGRGPGETKLEIDRRRAQQRVAQLQREIGKLGKRRRLRRQVRTGKEIPTVSIVGYTNVGKSTLLNRLTQSNVTEENVLFATLNPVSRRLRFPKEREVIITDTVGFIRDLPKELMEAFRTTFEEIEPAQLLLHVLDASDPEVEERYASVQLLLKELGFHHKPSLVVLNKIDLCEADVVNGLAKRYNAVCVSALNRDSFAPLLEAMEARLWLDPDDGQASGEAPGEDAVAAMEQDAV
jgi:GTP-binding protein HflX